MHIRRTRLLWGAIAVVVALVVAMPALVRGVLWHREQNPVLRGERLAIEQGCFHCHRADGGGELANPGSRWGSVPRFRAGNAMMYADDRREIEAFIRFGAPRAWLDDPDARQRLDTQSIRMPAYGERLDEEAIADLVAFACASEDVDRPGLDDARAGRALARQHGCTSCHGVEGAGGRPNPGALGGFIPGFVGRNFDDLVRDRAEFDEWIRTGTNARLARNPIVRWFWQRQAIAMPAYRVDQLGDDEIDQLWAWVVAVREDARSRDAS